MTGRPWPTVRWSRASRGMIVVARRGESRHLEINSMRLEDLDLDHLAVDLHCHTRYSDGDWTPESLIADAAQLGIGLISLTDHDTVSGQALARAAARAASMSFITGIEVSLTISGHLYHVLTYDFDPEASFWTRFAERRRELRQRYILAQFDDLRQRGHDVEPSLARDDQGFFVDQPLAVALQRAGRAPTIDAAEQTLRGLWLRRPVELLYMDAAEFGAMIGASAAVCSVAHPARQESGVSDRLSEADLVQLRSVLPLVALEAYHPYHQPRDVDEFRALAARHGLAVTTGSDAHGVRVRRPLRAHPAALSRDFLLILQDRHRRQIAEPANATSIR